MSIGAIFALTVAAVAQDKTASSIAARINDQIITWSDVDAEYLKLDPERKDPGQRSLILRRMAERELFLQEARREKIEITKEEVDKTIEREMRNFRSEEAFDSFLATRLKLTRQQYREQKEIDLIMMHLISYKYYQWIQRPGTESPALQEFVTPTEMRTFFEENKKSYEKQESVTFYRITLQFTETTKDEKRKLAESLIRKIKAGTDPGLLGKIYSDLKDDSAIIVKELRRDNDLFPPEITTLIFDKLNKSELSDPVELKNSFNIFRILDKVKQEARPFEDEGVQKEIRTILEQEKRRKNRELLLHDILKRSYVQPADLFGELQK